MARVPVPVVARERAGPDVRFEITAVGDTTVTFRAGKMKWVVRSTQAIVVDPRRRDALVARLQAWLSVSSTGDATAVVTGQTGRITTDHFVVAAQPPTRWYQEHSALDGHRVWA